ncbi:MAG: hypothetical protein NWQ41_02050 [Saprospiraceae bacterium]|nr:hypothetical protein [Saprospiraceae bacterium]
MWKITDCRSNHKLPNPEGYCIAPFQGWRSLSFSMGDAHRYDMAPLRG